MGSTRAYSVGDVDFIILAYFLALWLDRSSDKRQSRTQVGDAWRLKRANPDAAPQSPASPQAPLQREQHSGEPARQRRTSLGRVATSLLVAALRDRHEGAGRLPMGETAFIGKTDRDVHSPPPFGPLDFRRMGSYRIAGVGRLRLPLVLCASVRRLAVDHGHAAREFGLRSIAELLGIAAGEVGIVVCFELRTAIQQLRRPIRKIAALLSHSPRATRLHAHDRFLYLHALVQVTPDGGLGSARDQPTGRRRRLAPAGVSF